MPAPSIPIDLTVPHTDMNPQLSVRWKRFTEFFKPRSVSPQYSQIADVVVK